MAIIREEGRSGFFGTPYTRSYDTCTGNDTGKIYYGNRYIHGCGSISEARNYANREIINKNKKSSRR